MKWTLIASLCITLTLFAAPSYSNPTADYFARFKYTQAEAMELLSNADGKLMSEIPEARNLLDDLGYWRLVRTATKFKFNFRLKAKIQAQYKYLNQAFEYEAGDLVWVKAETPEEKSYGIAQVNHRAQILEHIRADGTDFFSVAVYTDGADKMTQKTGTLYNGNQGKVMYYGTNYTLTRKVKIFTKAELDQLNSPGSSLPQDKQGEVLDWENDTIWRDKLEGFKTKMASKRFEINFAASAKEIEQQQQELMLQIFRYFKMDRNARSQTGQGIGKRACGGGVCFDQALVLNYAIQGLGQTLGIKSYNLNGTTVNPMGGHGFVRYDLKTFPQEVVFDQVFPFELWEEEFVKRNRQMVKNGFVQNNVTLADELATYPGIKLATSTWTGISDPGWADYGITPDFFARVPVGKALNPIPIDSNRAVNGLSSQRSLVDVAQNLQAKGPLATYTEQKITTLEKIDRERYQEELEKGSSLKSTLEKDLKIDPLLKVVPPRTFVPPRCGVILSKFNKVLSIFKKH